MNRIFFILSIISIILLWWCSWIIHPLDEKYNIKNDNKHTNLEIINNQNHDNVIKLDDSLTYFKIPENLNNYSWVSVTIKESNKNQIITQTWDSLYYNNEILGVHFYLWYETKWVKIWMNNDSIWFYQENTIDEWNINGDLPNLPNWVNIFDLKIVNHDTYNNIATGYYAWMCYDDQECKELFDSTHLIWKQNNKYILMYYNLWETHDIIKQLIKNLDCKKRPEWELIDCGDFIKRLIMLD